MKAFLASLLVILLPLVGQAQVTVQQAQAEAIRKYPELAIKDSDLNRRFLETYTARRQSDPGFFTDPKWPLKLADELAAPAPLPPQPETPAAREPEATKPASPAPAVPGEGVTTEWEPESTPKELNLEVAKFLWWAPAEVKVRGVLVLLPGRGGDGRGMARNAAWQRWAEENKFGLLGCFLRNPGNETGTYQGDPNGAISDLINKAVAAVLAENKIDLKNPPLCFWGHSAGGNVSQNYAKAYPERVVGAVLTRCPNGPGYLGPGKESVPLLILVGQQDKPEWVKSSVENYEKGKSLNAVWTLALHPKEGHGVGKTAELSAAFLSSAVRLRLPEAGRFDKESGKPKKIAKATTWLGDTTTLEVASAAQFKGKKNTATWLPDETVAKIWQSYLRGE